MHDDGISHLDVKPTNVLVHTDGTVYVSDFGCALQKDNLKGGLGDFAYFSPDRMAHCRYAMDRKGHTFEATEMASYFSGKAADAFAAGITLLEIANNKYPFSFEKNVIEMLNVRDSDYFEDRIEDAYEKIEKNFKNLTILPVLKGLLESKPRKRWTTLKAQEELLRLKPKSSPKELFADFMKALSEKETHPAKKEAVNTNIAPASSSATT